MACLAAPASKAAAQDPGPFGTAAASSGLTALYAWTVDTGPTRTIEVQLFGTVFPGAISRPTRLLDSDTASGLCPDIAFIPERKAFAVVYSLYEPAGTAADLSIRVALVSALTGRVLDSGTLLQRSIVNAPSEFRPQPAAFCPHAAYLTESRRLLVVWTPGARTQVGSDPLVWDGGTRTGVDAYWGVHFDPLQRSFGHPRPLRLGPSIAFTRGASEMNSLDVAYAPRSATGRSAGNVLVTCAGFSGTFPEQANFFTFPANTLSGAAPNRDDWPPTVKDRGFCSMDPGPGCLPSSVYSAAAFQSGLGFGPPRFAIATSDQLTSPIEAFATLFFVPPTCDAASCTLESPGRVVDPNGSSAATRGVNVEEGPCRVPGPKPGSTRGSSCAYVVLPFVPRGAGFPEPLEWGITAYGYGTFAASTPSPEQFLSIGELPGLERTVVRPAITALARLTHSTLPFAPAIAVLYQVIRVSDGTALDPAPRPYLIRLDTSGRLISPPGEAGFLE